MLTPRSLIQSLAESPYRLVSTTIELGTSKKGHRLEKGTIVEFVKTIPEGLTLASNALQQLVTIKVGKDDMSRYTKKILPVVILKEMPCKDQSGNTKVVKAGKAFFITHVDGGVVTLQRVGEKPKTYLVQERVLNKHAQVMLPLISTNK